MPYANFASLSKTEELDAAIKASFSEPIVLFKHSATCSISLRAEREMQSLNEESDPKIYQLFVQRSRNLSFHIAQIFGIVHESPQIIILQDGKAVFNTSHGHVRAQVVREALQTITA